MARPGGKTLRTVEAHAPGRHHEGSILFLCDGEECRVSLRAPRPVRRGPKWMVRLINLWVATMLPGLLLDLEFEIVAARSGQVALPRPPVDAMRFARGHVGLTTRELLWDDPQDGALNGLVVEAIIARAPIPPLRAVTPARSGRPSPSVAALLRHAVDSYSLVEMRSTVGDLPAPTS